jgi:hypothetical protein
MKTSFFRQISLWVIGLTIVVSSSSCFEILERITLKKDGSGEYLMQLEMGQMLSMLMAFGDLSDSSADGMSGMSEVKMDTTILFSMMPDSIKQSWQNPSITKNGVIAMVMDGDNSILTFNISLPFSNVTDIDAFGADMGSGFGALNSPVSGEDDNTNEMFFAAGKKQFSYKAGELTRKKVPFNLGDEEDEDMEMVKMMMGDASYTVEYILPGKVKKVNGLNYNISEDGHKVTRSVNFLDIMDQKADLGVSIQYK